MPTRAPWSAVLLPRDPLCVGDARGHALITRRTNRGRHRGQGSPRTISTGTPAVPIPSLSTAGSSSSTRLWRSTSREPPPSGATSGSEPSKAPRPRLDLADGRRQESRRARPCKRAHATHRRKRSPSAPPGTRVSRLRRWCGVSLGTAGPARPRRLPALGRTKRIQIRRNHTAWAANYGSYATSQEEEFQRVELNQIKTGSVIGAAHARQSARRCVGGGDRGRYCGSTRQGCT